MSFTRKLLGGHLLTVVSALTVVGLTSLGRTAAAAEKRGLKSESEPQALSNQQLAESIHLLQSIKKTLEMADHDYGGHRADAVHDIGIAERQLKRALEHAPRRARGSGELRTGGTGESHPEPQALSDTQLADAVPKLKLIAEGLQHAEHDYGGHRADAVSDLRAAVRQLEKALDYSRRHDQNKP